MIKLHKCSIPSWTKEYKTLDEAKEELLLHICNTCIIGDEWPDMPPSPPDINDIYSLLGTPCGCEYEVEVIE